MKTKTLMFLLIASILSGCMNCYVRCPGTDTKITTTYQSTRDIFAWSCVAMFPQLMSDASGDFQLYPKNIITIPVGVIFFVDDVCECILDTILWPFDAWLEDARKDAPRQILL